MVRTLGKEVRDDMKEEFSKFFSSGANGSLSYGYTNSQVFGGLYSGAFGPVVEEIKDEKDVGKTITEEKTHPREEVVNQPGEQISIPDLINQVKRYHMDLLRAGPPRLSKKVEDTFSSSYRHIVVAEGNLHSTCPDDKSFYLTSCFPKEGKTLASISLAYSLAVFSNRRVLLVDAHLTSPTIHLLFQITRGPGFLSLLSDTSKIVPGILPTYYENLFIIPNPTPMQFGTPFTSSELKRFLGLVSSSFDYIIFDGRPILSAPEPMIFASTVDAVIFVVECERTKWEVMQAAIEKILNTKGKVAGVILNKRKFYIPPAVYKIL